MTDTRHLSRQEKVAAILADWRARWPAVFTTPVPLAIGITRAIKAELGRGHSRDVSSTLHHWTRRSAYLRAVARGDMRRNLDGSAAGIPTDDARAHAQQLLAQYAHRSVERMRRRRAAGQASDSAGTPDASQTAASA